MGDVAMFHVKTFEVLRGATVLATGDPMQEAKWKALRRKHGLGLTNSN